MTGATLVTGASGFVGRHLVEALRRAGEPVVTHDTKDGDLSRSEPRAEDIRHVFHLAARTYVPDSWNDPRGFYEVNVLGTVNVLEFCRKRECSLTLLSSYVYGQPISLPISEDHALSAVNPYGNSKILAEQVAQFYQTAFRMPVTIVRAFNLYGPGQARHFLIPTLIAQSLDAASDTITVEDDRPRRDYIFVSDLIDLLLQTGIRAGDGIFNAGSGVSFSVREVADLIIGLAGTGKRFVSRGQWRRNEVLNTVADISRARDELGWTPRISLAEGLRISVESARGTLLSSGMAVRSI